MPIANALQVCGVNGQQAITAFNHDSINNVAHFALMTDKDVIRMCKSMQERPIQHAHGYWIGALQIKQVRALAHWARNLRNRQLPIDDNAFTEAACDAAMAALDIDKADETELKKPPKLKSDEWDTWEPEFLNYLKSLKGHNGTPFNYIVRDPNLMVNDSDAGNEVNRLVYSVALAGPIYNQDNRRVAQELYSLIAGTSAANFVDEASWQVSIEIESQSRKWVTSGLSH